MKTSKKLITQKMLVGKNDALRLKRANKNPLFSVMSRNH